MTSREKVLTRLDSTGIRREDEAAVPVNGVTVPLPYMVIRTIEKDTWDDLGRVCVKTIMWTIALFTANKDVALECKIRKALAGLGTIRKLRGSRTVSRIPYILRLQRREPKK